MDAFIVLVSILEKSSYKLVRISDTSEAKAKRARGKEAFSE